VPAPGGMTLQGMTMTEFTEGFLAGLPFLDRPVIDETGLSGRFTFTLKMVDDDSGTADLKRAAMTAGPDSIIHAFETVGLRLERAKIQAEVLVVDRAERAPVEN
jgi:bla regulator protein blaR1